MDKITRLTGKSLENISALTALGIAKFPSDGVIDPHGGPVVGALVPVMQIPGYSVVPNARPYCIAFLARQGDRTVASFQAVALEHVECHVFELWRDGHPLFARIGEGKFPCVGTFDDLARAFATFYKFFFSSVAQGFNRLPDDERHFYILQAGPEDEYESFPFGPYVAQEHLAPEAGEEADFNHPAAFALENMADFSSALFGAGYTGRVANLLEEGGPEVLPVPLGESPSDPGVRAARMLDLWALAEAGDPQLRDYRRR